MQTIALVILFAGGAWLIGAGALMAIRPERALRMLRATAATHRVNLTEQVPRLIAGAAAIIRSDASKLPELFEIGGWFVVVSSVVLMIVPLRWHAGYAIWWARRTPSWAVRLIAPFSAGAGVGLVYASF